MKTIPLTSKGTFDTNASRKTKGHRDKMRRGAALAAALGEPLVPLSVAAKRMGISGTLLRNIECLALAKVADRLKEIAIEDVLINTD